MSMKKFTKRATDKNTFKDLGGFISFCSDFLSFISDPDNIQAEIVSQNEYQYQFLCSTNVTGSYSGYPSHLTSNL